MARHINSRAFHRLGSGWRSLALSASLVILQLGLGGCAAVSYWTESLGGSEAGGDASDGAIAGEAVPAQSSDIADGVENPESPAPQALSETSPELIPQAASPAASNETTDDAEEAQIAVLPAAGPVQVQARILFRGDTIELSGPAKVELIRVAKMLTQDQTMRVQLLAFAQGSDSGTGSAGRISLTRAFVVRAFLLDQGVQPVRVNLRSLADQVQNGPPDRVDVLLASPSG